MPTDADGNDQMEIVEIAVSDGGAPRLAVVDIKSGDDDCDLVWEQTGKLLRYDEGENQWKERGQGIAKVMKTKGKEEYTFVFRREGVGKLAAQHHLIKGMEVKLHTKNPKFVLWTASKDYTDDPEGYTESFILKTPSVEIAKTAVEQMSAAIAKSAV